MFIYTKCLMSKHVKRADISHVKPSLSLCMLEYSRREMLAEHDLSVKKREHLNLQDENL